MSLPRLYMMTPTWAVIATVPTFLRGRVSLAKIRELGDSLDAVAPERVDVAESRSSAPRVRIELERVTFSYPAPAGDERPFSVGPIDAHFLERRSGIRYGRQRQRQVHAREASLRAVFAASGRILLNGTPIDDSNREQYREHFAAIFADYHLFERLFGIDTVGREAQIQEYLALLRLDRKVRIEGGRFSSTALSSGQRKRLALLTAFLEDRPVYIFDEWAADQDPSYKEVFYLRLLPELKARGKCVIVVTHDDRYFHLGDRMIKLEPSAPVSDVREGGAPAVVMPSASSRA